MNPAETDADERPIHGARDRLPQRGLADPRGPYEAQDRRLAMRRQFADREIFDDAALDLLQAVMILVENPSRLGNVDGLFGRQRPWQLDQPVEIAADHAGLAGRFRHALVAAHLLFRLAFRLRRHPRLGDRLVQLRDLLRLAVAFAQLTLNGRHLLAQDGLALAFVESRLGLLADLRRQPQHFKPLGEVARNLLHALREVDGFQDLLLVLRLDVHIGGGEIGERRRRGGGLECGEKLRRRLRQQLNGFDGEPLQVEKTRLDLRRTRGGLRNMQHPRHRERRARQEIENAGTLDALADDVVGFVGRGNVTHDVRDRANPKKLVGSRVVRLGVSLQQDPDRPLLAQRLLGGGDRFGPPDGDRRDHPRKQHGIAHGNDDQGIAGDRHGVRRRGGGGRGRSGFFVGC